MTSADLHDLPQLSEQPLFESTWILGQIPSSGCVVQCFATAANHACVENCLRSMICGCVRPGCVQHSIHAKASLRWVDSCARWTLAHLG